MVRKARVRAEPLEAEIEASRDPEAEATLRCNLAAIAAFQRGSILPVVMVGLLILGLLPSEANADSGPSEPARRGPHAFHPSPTSALMRGPQSKPGMQSAVDLDFTFLELSLEYLHTGDVSLLERIARSPAMAHLVRHASHFRGGPAREAASPPSLLRELLSPRTAKCKLSVLVRSCALSARQILACSKGWVQDCQAYLPSEFGFRGSLFFTFGYDIGVAFPPNASINLAHAHFAHAPREVLYYAIHELHHVGFMTYQPPPRPADIRTCGDLLRLVEYCTQLEGMAVHAALPRRRADGRMEGDSDYAALSDAGIMKRLVAEYFRLYGDLAKRKAQPADSRAFSILERMSTGDRLWYRVGAHMADEIESRLGRATLVDLVREGPAAFLDAFTSARSQ